MFILLLPSLLFGTNFCVGSVPFNVLRCSLSPSSMFKPLTLELNPSAQSCLTRFFTGDFASLTAHFVNICAKNQQMQQLFSLLIMYGSSYMFRHYIAILMERS
jgi:hypothetical protein